MIDIKLLKQNFDAVREKLLTRHSTGKAFEQLGGMLDEFLTLDDKRRELITSIEEKQQKRNSLSKDIGIKKRNNEDADELQNAVHKLKQELEDENKELDTIREKFDYLIYRIPNVPDETTPLGKTEDDNVVVSTFGEPKNLDFEAKQHFEIGEKLGILDLECAAKLAGSRFGLMAGAGAKLERALINFMLDLQTEEHGYTEFAPPFIVNAETMQGTGQLPKFEDDLFKLEGERPMYLIPTAEVPLTNIHAGEILEEKDLPKLYTAFTPCFRREAGAAGKDTRGIMRVHQFNKVELVNIVKPEASKAALETMVKSAEKVLQLLEIPYRVMELCTADIGFSATKTYDIEVWLPGQNCYREISSCSNCKDFQARRANIRFRPESGGKPEFAHTLNGSGLAAGRTWLAVIENYQQADGSVIIPKVLRPYMGGLEKITKNK